MKPTDMVANGLFVYEKVYRNKKFLVTEGQNSKITPKLIILSLAYIGLASRCWENLIMAMLGELRPDMKY